MINVIGRFVLINGKLNKMFRIMGVALLSFSVVNAQQSSSVKIGGGKLNESGLNKTKAVSLSDGDLDPTFGTGGIVTSDYGSFGQIRDIGIQSNGKIILGGFNGGGFLAMRFNADGTLDTGYGTGGKVEAGNNQSYKTLIQSDDKVVLVGYDGDNNPSVIRLDTLGVLDNTFGTGGVVVTSGIGGYCYGAALQADGKILLTTRNYNGSNYDMVIVRLNTDGSLDETFNGSGHITVDFGGWEDSYGVAEQSDGKILFCGASWNSGTDQRFLAVGRLKADGTLDSTGFGTNGKVLSLFPTSMSPWNIYPLTDSKILIAGTYDSKFMLVRYDNLGNLDSDFNATGKVFISFPQEAHSLEAAVQSDGKVIIGGSVNNGADYDFAAARVNVNGSLDTDFNGTGMVTTPLGGSDFSYGIKIQSDGKAIVAGMTGSQVAAMVRYYITPAAVTAPTVVMTDPAPNDRNIQTNQAINITFSQPMDQSTQTTSNIRVVGSISGDIGGGFGYANSNSLIAFNVSPDYQPGEKVTVTVTTRVKNSSGISFETPYSWSFTVKSATATASLTQYDIQVGGAINSGPNDVDVADVDRDGDADLVYSYKGFNKFMVALNNGSGSFSAPTDYVGFSPKMGYTADFNNDGYPDYVGMTQRDYGNFDSLHVYLNDGDGGFVFSDRYSIGADNYYGAFTIGDTDGDGYIDLISTHNYSNQVVVLRNNGDGTFDSAVSYNSNNRPRTVTTGDFNKDGYLDIIVGNEVSGTDSVTVLYNDGTGAFPTNDQISLGADVGPLGVICADFNNDGFNDIATANAAGSISVILNDGSGGFGTLTTVSAAYGRYYLSATDLNGDGNLDIASTGGNTLITFLGNGDGTFQTGVGQGSMTSAGGFDVADLNDDDAIDVICTATGVWFAKLYLNTPTTVPVELSSFSAQSNNGKILLNWSTVTESNNAGWEIETLRHTSADGQGDNEAWDKIGFVNGKGTTTELQNYQFQVESSKYQAPSVQFRLKQIDTDGKFSYSNILTVDLTPNNFGLSQNYPNPFNPVTVISYQLSAVSDVRLAVYDLLGREVMTLVNEKKEAGNYSVKFSGTNLTSGVYFYKLTAGSFTEIKKMTLLK